MENRGAKRRGKFPIRVYYSQASRQKMKIAARSDAGIVTMCRYYSNSSGETITLDFTISYFQYFRMGFQLITALSAISYSTQNPGRQLINEEIILSKVVHQLQYETQYLACNGIPKIQ